MLHIAGVSIQGGAALGKALQKIFKCQVCIERQRASQVAVVVKKLAASAGDIRDTGSIPGLGRSPRGGHSNPPWYSCWGIPWTEEPGGLQSIGSQSQTRPKRLSTHTEQGSVQ